MYLNDIYTIAAKPRRHPGDVAAVRLRRRPARRHAVDGQLLRRSRLLNVAHQYQLATDFHRQMPKGFE